MCVPSVSRTGSESIRKRLRNSVDQFSTPVLAEEESAEAWFARPGAPKPALENEKPQGRAVPYTDLLELWQ